MTFLLGIFVLTLMIIAYYENMYARSIQLETDQEATGSHDVDHLVIGDERPGEGGPETQSTLDLKTENREQDVVENSTA